MSNNTSTYPLRLPKSIKAAAERLSKADDKSLNQFVATAVAEKIAVLEATAFFEARASRARARAECGEPSALLRTLSRTGGEPPREGDELRVGYVPLATSATAVPAKPASRSRRAANEKAG